MTIIKNVLFWFLATLLILFVLFLATSLLFLFYPQAFNISSNTNASTICPIEQFPCANSLINDSLNVICLDRWRHCDGVKDCPFGDDELYCVDHSGRLIESINVIHQKLKNIALPNQQHSLKHCTIEMYFRGKCSCNLRDETVIFCENSNLTRIPHHLSRNITKLFLNNNSITQLDGHVLGQYTELESLYLDNNLISDLADNLFINLKNIKNLSLRGNLLRAISKNGFDGLNQLRMMYLEYNKIIHFELSSLSLTSSLKLLVIGHNMFDLDGQSFPRLLNLSWLVLDNNQITRIDSLLFQNLPMLKTLHMKKNLIAHISSHAFRGNSLLQELDLSENRLNTLFENTFYGLHNLNKLILKENGMRSLPTSIFHNLAALESLDLRGIIIDNINLDHFSRCVRLRHIYFIKFRYCSYAPHVRICRPATDGLSSAEHLLVLPLLRYSVWVVAVFTCVGNIVVLIWRSVSKKEDHVLSLFIKNLSAADLLMGIYLCAIGVHDLAFRDDYRRHALWWTCSWSCTICGSLAMISSEVSVFTLLLITVERYRCITANFRVVTISAAKMNLALIWIIACVLAFYPVIHWSTTGDQVFYASNGLCFPLHIDEPYTTGWQYSALVFLGINFPAVLLMITLYMAMFCIIKRDRKHSRPIFIDRKREDAILALRFFGIVFTDCLCWIPIVIIKIIALSHIPISSNIYAWVVVFVLPINSALNPIFYTLVAPTELRRKMTIWCQQNLHDMLTECPIINKPKTERNSASVISRLSSITPATEVRSSNGSAVSLPLNTHCVHMGSKSNCHTVKTLHV